LAFVGVGDERRSVRFVDRVYAPFDAGAYVWLAVETYAERREMRVVALEK
jgi:hypothetical protein